MSPTLATLTGTQKAATVLAQLDMDRAARVLRAMTEMEVVELMAEMARLPELDTDTVRNVLIEFVDHTAALMAVGQGGVEAARKLLHERLGPSRAEEIIEQFTSTGGNRPMAFLHRIDPLQVASFLADEHPQTIAVVLAHLPSESAAAVLENMDEALRVEVARRIATMGRISPDVIQEIADVIDRKLSVLVKSGGAAINSIGGVGSLVGILNSADRNAEKQILSDLDTADPELAEEVRKLLFVFDDVVRLDDRTLQRVLRNVVPKELAVALKGANEDVRAKFMRNMSERAATDLVEEIEVLGPTRLSAVEAAQAEVVKVVRQMEVAGEIVLSRGADDMVV